MTDQGIFPNVSLKLGYDLDTTVPMMGTEWGFELDCPSCGKKIRIEHTNFAIRVCGETVSITPTVACPHQIKDTCRRCQWVVWIRDSVAHLVT